MESRPGLKSFVSVGAVAVGLLLLLLISLNSPAAAQPAAPDAQITLLNAPSPPAAIRPGEAQLFHWEIVASTTPLSVSYKLTNIDSGALIEFHSDRIEALQEEIAARLGYRIERHHLVLYGRKVRR